MRRWKRMIHRYALTSISNQPNTNHYWSSFVVLCFQFYQELLFIQQTEMAAPSQGSYLTPAGHIMPAYSGRGRPPLNPQQQQHNQVVSRSVQMSLMWTWISDVSIVPNIFSSLYNSSIWFKQLKNRLMNMNNGNPRLPAPTVSPQVIEID